MQWNVHPPLFSSGISGCQPEPAGAFEMDLSKGFDNRLADNCFTGQIWRMLLRISPFAGHVFQPRFMCSRELLNLDQTCKAQGTGYGRPRLLKTFVTSVLRWWLRNVAFHSLPRPPLDAFYRYFTNLCAVATTDLSAVCYIRITTHALRMPSLRQEAFDEETSLLGDSFPTDEIINVRAHCSTEPA